MTITLPLATKVDLHILNSISRQPLLPTIRYYLLTSKTANQMLCWKYKSQKVVEVGLQDVPTMVLLQVGPIPSCT